MKERCPSGSAPAFLRRRRGRPDRIVGSRGRGLFSPEPAESRMGGLTVRGQRCVLLVRGPHVLPEEPTTLLSPSPLLRPSPTLLSPSDRRCSRTEPALLLPRTRLLLPEPALWAQAPPLSSLSSASSALRACVLDGRKRAFACGVPGALRGTWVSPTRFDEMNDPCPGNVLI
jgi:hypothetical protein